MSFTMPERFVRFQMDARGAEGAAWLERLPTLIEEGARQWSLAVEPPFADLSINYVTPATCTDRTIAGHAMVDGQGAPVVLKICYPARELYTEIAALRLFDGCGIARLLAADQARGALLIEHLQPGTPLATITDDEQATAIAVKVMRQLWRRGERVGEGESEGAGDGLSSTRVPPFPTVADWVLGMRERGPEILPRDRTFPVRWVDRALGLYADLAARPTPAGLLHGDLHHTNILTAEREPWLAIDPQGVIGPAVWETGPLLLNELPPEQDTGALRRVLARRTEQLAAELGLDHAELVAWGVVRAVLSAFWSLEDEGYGWEGAMAVAKVLEGLQKGIHTT